MMMNTELANKLLEVQISDSIDTVKSQYKKLVLIRHPDRNREDPNANDNFIQLREAYHYLLKQRKHTSNRTQNDSNEFVPMQLPPNEFTLFLTLEEILRGCVKHEKITRKIVKRKNQTTIKSSEEKVLLVNVIPGIATGARIIIEKEGDIEHPDQIPANIVFIVAEHKHAHFRRSRFHLEYTAELTSEQLYLDGTIQIPTLEGDFITLEVADEEIITNNTVKRIPERGLPVPKNKNKERGDIIVQFKIIYGK